MKEAIQDPDIRERIINTGFVPTDYSPDQYLELCNSVRDQLESAKEAILWEEEQVRALNN